MANIADCCIISAAGKWPSSISLVKVSADRNEKGIIKSGATLCNGDNTSLDSDNDMAVIAMMESFDMGKSWSQERVVSESGSGLNCISPALCRLADGGLGLAYSRRDSLESAMKVFFCRSNYAGKY
ncbi:MAG: hypothetical protein HQ557_12840 [Bacteroidetes bacterium]|nr:hypothetical protein [Bacteroidota bacterium]